MTQALYRSGYDQAQGSNPLATADQLALEKQALAIFNSEPVRRAREKARKLLLDDSSAQTRSGAAGLERALDQWVMGQVAATINSDPSRPRLFWSVDNTARFWFNQSFPGAAVAIDNPDNINRVAPLNGEWSYRITGRFGNKPVGQESFQVTEAASGQLRWGDAVAAMTDQEIERDNDGNFVLTLDSQPANGRTNHLQITPGPLQLAVRDSHSDWAQQPTALTLEVIAGPQLLPELDENELIEQCAAGVQEFVEFWLGFKNTFWNTPPFNTIVGPNVRAREGNWGTQAGGRFLLNDNQALVITTQSGGAEYTGFQVSDPWTISPTPINRTTSRNLAQISPNLDGTYSYILSLVDTGYANWIDTDGLNEGWFMLRWQNLPADAEVEKLVRDIKLVALDELQDHVPEGCPRVTIEQRYQEMQQRIAQHRTRTNS